MNNNSNSNNNAPIISIVVCTYNREQFLPDCLEALARQPVDNQQFEVLVIDNNSTDNTSRIAGEFVDKHSNFKYFFESQQGLSHARNRGLAEAGSQYVAYIDDDVRPGDQWLPEILSIIETEKPDIFGGPAFPVFPEGKPPWYNDAYGIRGDMGETGPLKKGFLIGTNIVFKKSLLEEYGGFDPHLGMTGKNLAYGEETALVFRALAEGKHVYYSREMAVEDRLPEYKKSIAFFLYYWYKAGKDLSTMENHGDTSTASPLIQANTGLPETIDHIMSKLETALIESQNNPQKWPFPENYIVEKVRKSFVDFGKYMGHLLQQDKTPNRGIQIPQKQGDDKPMTKNEVKINSKMTGTTIETTIDYAAQHTPPKHICYSPEEKREIVSGFQRWNYQFDLGDGVVTDTTRDDHMVWQNIRKELFMNTINNLFKDSLRGKTFLDIGCNAGFWSFEFAKLGTTYGLAVDKRSEKIRQAEFVRNCIREGDEYDHIQFKCCDIFDLPLPERPFDFILAFGVLYHFTDPVGFLRKLHRMVNDFVFIDTAVSPLNPGTPVLEMADGDKYVCCGKKECAFIPNEAALMKMLRQTGFSNVVKLTPRHTNEAVDGFSQGIRTAVIAFKD